MDEISLLNRFRREVPLNSGLAAEERRLFDTIRGDADGVPLRPGRRRSRPFRPLAVAGAAGLAIAAGAAIVQLSTGPTPGGRAGPAEGETLAIKPVNAAVVLEKAARTAESRPSAKMPGPKQWQYAKTLSRQTDGSTETWEMWHRIDDRAMASYTGGFSYEFFEESCKNPAKDPQMCGDGTLRLRVTKTRPIRETDPDDDDLGPGQYAKKLRQLPTDPDKLLKHVTGDRHWIDYPKSEKAQKKDKEDPAARAFRVLGVYLKQQALMPPDLEAAIYRALSRIPDVKTKEGVPDGAGRTGIGVHRDLGDDAPSERYLVLEPETYRYLGDSTVWLKADKGEGTARGAIWSEAVLDAGLVDEPGERP